MRLDHLLSKECYRPSAIVSIMEERADHYPVEHWLFGCSRIPADDWPPSMISLLCSGVGRRPPFTDRSLRGQSDSRYFVLKERPLLGLRLLVMSPLQTCRLRAERVTSRRARRSALRAPRALFSSVAGSVVGGGRTAHPVRAPVGRTVPAASRFWLICEVWSGSSGRGVALHRPLRIPKRARASLFSKLQRANGGCLGA